MVSVSSPLPIRLRWKKVILVFGVPNRGRRLVVLGYISSEFSVLGLNSRFWVLSSWFWVLRSWFWVRFWFLVSCCSPFEVFDYIYSLRTASCLFFLFIYSPFCAVFYTEIGIFIVLMYSLWIGFVYHIFLREGSWTGLHFFLPLAVPITIGSRE